MSTDSQPIEQVLAHQVASMYQRLVGHSLRLVSCHFMSQHSVAIILEGAVTQPEKLLLHSGYTELATTLRQHLNDILRPRLVAETETVLAREVIDTLSDGKIESDRMSFIMILAKRPSKEQRGP